MAGGVWTYDDTSRREDLASILKDVSPSDDNMLVSTLETGQATQTLHEWLIDHIDRPTSDDNTAEGADWAEDDNDQPTRSHNITAIAKKSVKVTRTQQKIATGLKKKTMAYQRVKALRELKAKMEFKVVNGVKASGASGTARGMAGLIGVISSHVTARNSGTSFSSDELEDMLQDVWDDVGSEFVSDHLLMPMGIKRKVSTFSGFAANQVNNTDKVFNKVDIYEGSAGTVRIVPHRDVNKTAGTVHVIAIRKEHYRIAYLDKPHWQKMGKTGDHERGQYLTEFTLESLAQRASAMRTGYNQNG